MSEIRVKIPEGIPISPMKRKIDELIKEEEIKWALFEKCKDELLISPGELEELEKIREEAWQKTKKKYGL